MTPSSNPLPIVLSSTVLRRALLVATAFSLLAAAGCSSGERIDVGSAAGPGVNFESRGDTFDWVPENTANTRDPWNEVPSVHSMFREIVQDDLASKGYRRVSGGPVASKLTDRLVRRTVGNVDNPGVDRRINTVTLEVLDPDTGKVVWHTTAEVEFRESAQSSAEIRERLEKVVKKMLEPIKNRNAPAKR